MAPTRESETMMPAYLGVTTFLFLLSLLTYALRLWNRLKPHPSLGWDDLAISLAMVLAMATWGCSTALIMFTGGKHVEYVDLDKMMRAARLGFAIMPLWIWSVTMVKISVCLMLLRIKRERMWQRGLLGLIGVLLVIAVAGMVSQLLQCRPLRANWNIYLKLEGGHCWDNSVLETVTYVLSALFGTTDLVCAFLPLFFIRQLNRPLREKIVLALLMALGLLAAACSIVKAVLLKKLLNSADPLWDGEAIGIWTYSEVYIGIIAANIPCLRSLLEKVFTLIAGSQAISRKATIGPIASAEAGVLGRGNGGMYENRSHICANTGSRGTSDEHILLSERGEKKEGIVKEVEVRWDDRG
ncbi:hypothetical protein EJ06DRAFT_522802 [Trichodelitschia bisporula]|uniref:Rhodopsin domain-containing protein n=1 Tax=Trichodelitschia bisporula TaxID=703511 RepID=A0A6G1HU90_9PEZI|nr:hypothetical protein EJ06DRAFT_522802 [Trichodelitschia bisporula]